MNLSTSFFVLSVLSSSARSFSTHRALSLATATSSTTPQKNPSPNHVVLMSKPTQEDEQAGKIWDRFAEGYSKQAIADEESYQKKLEVTRSYFQPHMKVVEIGCGTGSTSLLHAPYVHSILATDVSSKMIEIGRTHAERQGVTNVKFQQASVEELDLPPASQDVVLGLNVLHLLPRRQAAMRKMHTWLRPGGYLVTSTACIGDMGWPVRWMMRSLFPVGAFLGFLPRVQTFTKDELRQEFLSSGFQVEHEWQPKEGAAVFVVAKKPTTESN